MMEIKRVCEITITKKQYEVICDLYDLYQMDINFEEPLDFFTFLAAVVHQEKTADLPHDSVTINYVD